MARNSKYTPKAVKIICDALQEGETQKVACARAGISEDSFERWQQQHADFAVAVKKAKQIYNDWELVGILSDAKKSLKVLICGQEYEEVKTEYKSDANGQPVIKSQVRTTKKILPNATAVIFALCNRDPEHWQNRINADVNSKVTAETKTDLSLANVPDDLLAQVIEAINGK